MKKILLIIITFISFSMADSVLIIKKGWQLVGSSVVLNSMSKFTTTNVEQVWHFDAKSQKWLGYSPDASVQKRMEAKDVEKLKSLKNWHGFWIKSKKDWSLSFEDKTLTSEPNQSSSSDMIELKKGWNLISLPVDSVLSADIFEGMTVWKYNSDKKWELADSTMERPETFPFLGHIKNSDGLWVKADKDRNISVMQEASKLHNFKDEKEMKAYITEMATLSSRPYCGIEPIMRGFEVVNSESFDDAGFAQPMVVNGSASGSRNASGTNLQEQGVDESDIMKHNGKYLFYIGSKDGQKEHINISSFDTLTKSDSPELNRVSFSDNRTIDSFYLVDNRLIVLSRFYPSYENKDSGVKVVKSLVDIFDVSDIMSVKKVASYTLDGSFKNSRVIKDRLYLISSFTPQYDITYPKEYLTPSAECKSVLSALEPISNNDYTKYAECFNIIEEDGRYYRYNYDKPNVKITYLLPKIKGTALAEQMLVTPKRLYASAKQNQAVSMTTISSFSLSKAKYLKSTSFVGESSVEYASSKSLYLLSYAYPYFYDFNNYKQRSIIYKFNFDDDLSYGAVGAVSGTALNQFSLSEESNILRIATTEGFSWSSLGTQNRLYTLKEDASLLKIEGTLSGLGKEGESIKSVRFMGNRAYLVTFKTTDPLYTIDLSNPKLPKKMGELEIEGYSAYLHPVGEDKLLGIGQNTDSDGNRKGVKIELFDISDFEHPSSLDSILLAEGSSSELERNHKSLAYRDSDNLFAFPYRTVGEEMIGINTFEKEESNQEESDSVGLGEVAPAPTMHNYLGIYQVKNDSLKEYKVIENNSSYGWGEHRGLIFDNNGTTYISFFADNQVISKILTEKDK